MAHRQRLFASLLLCASACDSAKPDAEAQKTAQTEKAVAAPSYDRVPRMDFNRIAAELALPIFWVEDKNNDKILQPEELTTYWGLNTPALPFGEAYEKIAAVQKNGHTAVADAADAKRRASVLKELSQGRQTVVQTSFKASSDEDKLVVKNILEAAKLIEKLHAQQLGISGMEQQIAADDTASRMLFYRNQGPWCEAPETENDPDCNALASRPKRIVGVYPESVQKDDEKFCEKLSARKDAEKLMHQFHVVREQNGELVAVPYTEAYKAEMETISKLLKTAADGITSADEAAFKAYLTAASQSFLDNNWQPADEAWSKMNATNSKWYLRIGPDEVYWEPCSRKAGFHVSFARINQGSIEWQNKLEPVKNDMEGAFAQAGGKPYKARKVSFHLPDFIDIIVNAGDSRPAHGATIGQSLPNWGPVANEGRGRTVAMTNLYSDADSARATRDQAESLFCASVMPTWSDEYSAQLMSTVLHEAAHNLGPSHEYKVGGKTDDQVFGGPIASMLEELKAQTGALYFTDWLLEKGILDKAMADKSHVREVAWSFGHISRGMYDAQGKPRPYSQLAAIQFGFLLKEGAIAWNAEELAANGKDKGCISVALDKFPEVTKKLAVTVVGIKARGDKKLAASVKEEFVDRDGLGKELLGVIKDRWLRAPKASFVYSVEL